MPNSRSGAGNALDVPRALVIPDIKKIIKDSWVMSKGLRSPLEEAPTVKSWNN